MWESPAVMLKAQIIGTHPKFPMSRSRWGTRIPISSQFLSEADAAGPETTIWDPLG